MPNTRSTLREFESVQAVFASAISAYPGEIDRRDLVQRPARLFEVAVGAKQETGAPAIPGGSMLVVTGNPKSEIFRKIVSAAESGNAVAVSDTINALENSLKDLPLASRPIVITVA